ncbi:MAG: potassium transporter TrkA [Candidatus Entotheonella factor]|uniref:Potassium transporter TrkA n=1 Tax=Entotheonella factor TaxID=1429438 RepID=W4LNN5_ENTF1|nr:MAG: potassium transporter TrkA [Candidatus Entotheonella factor]
MNWDAWVTLGVTGLVFGLLAGTQISPDVILCGGVTLLVTLQVLTPAEAIAGMANEGMVTVALLFIVAVGLRETGGMAMLMQPLLGHPRSLPQAQTRLMAPVVVMSAFLNNTPLVAMLLPVASDWGRRYQLSVSKLLMPLSFASILGGTCTLIGTSTNLLVSALLAKEPGMPRLALLDMAWVGLPCALIGGGFMLLSSRWLLPERRKAAPVADDAKEYTIEMLVEPGGALEGQTIEQAGLRNLNGMYLMEINRDKQVLAAVSPHERLWGNDQLVFVGVVESIVDLQRMRGLIPATDQLFKLSEPRGKRRLVEAVVSSSCPLAGQTIRDGRFRTVYNAVVIAVTRNGERLRQKIGDIILWPGDTLLLETHSWFADKHRNSRDFYLVSRIEDSAPPRHERVWTSVGILGLMVALMIVGLMPPLNAVMLAAGLMILTKCCSAATARRSINWQVIIVIAAAFAMAQAMENTGAALAVAQTLLGLAGDNPWAALAMVYGVTMLFTNVITNNAAAVLIFPIALETAHSLGVSPVPFMMALMMAASCGFATPIAYQTNLMVYGPGGYRFSDYLRFGGPLSLLLWGVTVTLTPLFWPF